MTARFPKTYCSQCGGEFGPGNEGFGHCSDHIAKKAPDAGERWTIDRAADLLEAYAGYIRTFVKSDDLELHPYPPEIDYVASQLRDWFGRCEAGDRCSCPSDEKRVKCAHWIDRATGATQ